MQRQATPIETLQFSSSFVMPHDCMTPRPKSKPPRAVFVPARITPNGTVARRLPPSRLITPHPITRVLTVRQPYESCILPCAGNPTSHRPADFRYTRPSIIFLFHPHPLRAARVHLSPYQLRHHLRCAFMPLRHSKYPGPLHISESRPLAWARLCHAYWPSSFSGTIYHIPSREPRLFLGATSNLSSGLTNQSGPPDFPLI